MVLENKKSSTPASDSDKSSSSGVGTLVIKTKDSNSSSPVSLFEQKTVNNLDSIKMKYSEILGSSRTVYVIVTSKNIYMLRMVQNPVDMYLGFLMQGRGREGDILARCWGLDRVTLMETAGDIR